MQAKARESLLTAGACLHHAVRSLAVPSYALCAGSRATCAPSVHSQNMKSSQVRKHDQARHGVWQRISSVSHVPALERQRCGNVLECGFGTRSASSALVRSPKYAQLEDRDIKFFQQILGPTGVITDHDDLVPYNTDWMKKYQGKSQLALRPKTTEQVSQIMSYCNQRCLAVVPQVCVCVCVGARACVLSR
jgi:hypothetical protein